jgi:hypothetical protein
MALRVKADRATVSAKYACYHAGVAQRSLLQVVRQGHINLLVDCQAGTKLWTLRRFEQTIGRIGILDA